MYSKKEDVTGRDSTFIISSPIIIIETACKSEKYFTNGLLNTKKKQRKIKNNQHNTKTKTKTKTIKQLEETKKKEKKNRKKNG